MVTDFGRRLISCGVHGLGVSSWGGVRGFLGSGVLATVYGFRHFDRRVTSQSG